MMLSPHTHSGMSRSFEQSPINNRTASSSGVVHNSQLTEIQMELELLKERRRALEQQRKLLLRSSLENQQQHSTLSHHQQRPASSMSPPPPAVHGANHNSTRSSSARSNRSNRSASRSETHRSSSAMDQRQFLPSEKERRQELSRNVYFEMKEAMKRQWATDSTLIGGYFHSEDNPKVSTFGRERRFTPIPGIKGPYYLATDIEEMQRQAKEVKGRHLTASSRGRPGCNVQSNWNDSRGGAAPGPGAYTPRYQKLAKPSVLTRM